MRESTSLAGTKRLAPSDLNRSQYGFGGQATEKQAAVIPPNLHKELSQMVDILSDVKTYDWKVRIDQLEKLKLLLMQVSNHFLEDPLQQEIALAYVMRYCQSVVVSQINDLRSTVAKHACQFVAWIANEFPETFGQQHAPKSSELAQTSSNVAGGNTGGNGLRYFREDALFKLVSNGNKTLSDLGHQTIVEILSTNPYITKVFPYLCAQMNSKNPLVRLRIAQYFEIVMKAFSLFTIEQNSDLIDIFLISATDDQNQEVRNQARRCFTLYRRLLRDKSTVLLLHGIKNINVRKQVMLELNLDIQELHQELAMIEHLEKRGQATQNLTDAQSNSFMATQAYDLGGSQQSLQTTPMRDKIQKMKNRYEGAKTPEQFIRARAKGTNNKSPMFSRSPMKGEREQEMAQTSQRQRSSAAVNYPRSRQQAYQTGGGPHVNEFRIQDTQNFFVGGNFAGNMTQRDNFEAVRRPVSGMMVEPASGLQTSRPSFQATLDQQNLGLKRHTSTSALGTVNNSFHKNVILSSNMIRQHQGEVEEPRQAYISSTLDSAHKGSDSQQPFQRSKSSLFQSKPNPKLQAMRRKYTPTRQQDSSKKTVNQTKRIKLDLTNAERASASRSPFHNDRPEGQFTERRNSKIGMGLRNAFAGDRSQTPNEGWQQQMQRAQADQSPMPFGKSPRPTAISPRPMEQILGHNYNPNDQLRRPINVYQGKQTKPQKPVEQALEIARGQRAPRVKMIAIDLNSSRSKERSIEVQKFGRPQRPQLDARNEPYPLESPIFHSSSSLVQCETPLDTRQSIDFMEFQDQFPEQDLDTLLSTGLEPMPDPQMIQISRTTIKQPFEMQSQRIYLKLDMISSGKYKSDKELLQTFTLIQELLSFSICSSEDLLCLQSLSLKLITMQFNRHVQNPDLEDEEGPSVLGLLESITRQSQEMCLVYMEEDEGLLVYRARVLTTIIETQIRSQAILTREKVRDLSFRYALNIEELGEPGTEAEIKNKLLFQIKVLSKLHTNLCEAFSKKMEAPTKVFAGLLSKILKLDDTILKQKDVVNAIFSLVLEACLKLRQKSTQADPLDVSDSFIDETHSETEDLPQPDSNCKAAVELLGILQTLHKKTGHVKELLVKLRQGSPDQYREVSVLTKPKDSPQLHRLLKEIVKQGYLAAGQTPIQKAPPKQKTSILNNFNWQKPNVQGATSHYNFRESVRVSKPEKAKVKKADKATKAVSQEKKVDKQRSRQVEVDTLKDAQKKMEKMETQEEQEHDCATVLSIHRVSPPKSMAHGYQKIFQSQSKYKHTEQEDQSLINTDILRQAQPVTSVLNFAEVDEGQTTPRNTLDSTIVVRCPLFIEEDQITDNLFEVIEPIKKPRSRQEEEKSTSENKGKSQTTASDIQVAVQQKRSGFDWRKWLEVEQSSDPEEAMSVYLQRLRADSGEQPSSEAVLATFQELIAPLVTSWSLSTYKFARDPSDFLTELIDILELTSSFPSIQSEVRKPEFYLTAILAALNCQALINRDKNVKAITEADRDPTAFEILSFLLMDLYEVQLLSISRELQSLILKNLKLLEELTDFGESMSLEEDNALFTTVQLIEIASSLVSNSSLDNEIFQVLRLFLCLLLEVQAGSYLAEDKEPMALINHPNIQVRRSVILSLVDLKYSYLENRPLLQLIDKYLSAQLNQAQMQIVNIYFKKRMESKKMKQRPISTQKVSKSAGKPTTKKVKKQIEEQQSHLQEKTTQNESAVRLEQLRQDEKPKNTIKNYLKAVKNAGKLKAQKQREPEIEICIPKGKPQF